jgi:hypothetical protein
MLLNCVNSTEPSTDLSSSSLLSRSLHQRRLSTYCHPLPPPQSGRTEHNEPLPLLTFDLEARVQPGPRSRLRQPAPDDPEERV